MLWEPFKVTAPSRIAVDYLETNCQRGCPAQLEKNRAIQLDPATQEVALCLTKSWLRALALDFHHNKDLSKLVRAVQIFMALRQSSSGS